MTRKTYRLDKDDAAFAKLITDDLRSSEDLIDTEIEKMLRWPSGIFATSANLIHADLRPADLSGWPSKEELAKAELVEWEECDMAIICPALH